MEVAGLSSVAAIAAGTYHSIAVKEDGTVWAWGLNAEGQVGDGSVASTRLAPVQVTGLAGVTAIAAGGRHTLALLADGTVRAWGANDAGQLGDSTTIQRNAPVPVTGLSNVIAVAAGATHSLALKSDGAVVAWGFNAFGQLGLGDTTNRHVPTPITSLGTNVGLIAAGSNHSLAVNAGGNLYVWGNNANSQIGNGNNANQLAPVLLATPIAVTSIAGGSRHSAAITADRRLYVWGDNFFGQVGNRSGNYNPHSASLNVLRGDSVISSGTSSTGTGIGTGSNSGSSILEIDNQATGFDFGSRQAGASVQVAGKYRNASLTESITGVALGVSGSGFGLQSSDCPGTLAPDQECNFAIAFSPATAASYQGELLVASSVVGSPERRSLHGSGVAPDAAAVTFSTGGLDFPPVTVGSASAVTQHEITNSGNVNLTVTGTTSTLADYLVSHDCVNVAPGASCSLSVTFRPTLAGSRVAYLSVASNAAGSPHSVTVYGTGATTIDPPATQVLSISRTSTGAGVVTSNPAGIACGTACSAAFDTNSSVTLTATPSAGSIFMGWSGACTGSDVCTVTMDAATSVTAIFSIQMYTLAIGKSGSGSGVVTSNTGGISCGATCSADYTLNASVILTASPDATSTFTGWSGACSGAGTCTVTMDGAKSVTATFTRNNYSLTVTKGGSGSGTVTSSPTGIDCGSTCGVTFAGGTPVTLIATATSGSGFTGWGGACTGSGSCQMTMDGAKSVAATFADSAAPDTTLTTKPPSLTNNASATFAFTSSEAGSTFECSLDGVAFAACTSPLTLNSLANGSHTFAVRSKDAAGNVDPTPATHTWTVDTVLPSVAFTAKPAITAANQATYSVAGTCSENGRAVTVTIGSLTLTPNCTSGQFATAQTNVAGLPPGSVTLVASITDEAGNTASATDSTTKDTTAPNLTIGTLDPINAANARTYGFTGTCEAGGGSVNYTLASGPTINGTAACASGMYTAANINITTLTDGTVTITVTQADTLGNTATATGSTPKDTANPSVTIDAPPAITAANQSAYVVSGTCSETGRAVALTIGTVDATVSCAGGAYQAIGISVSALDDGPVTLKASLTDLVGNSATATASATKDTAASGTLLITGPTAGSTTTPNPPISGSGAEAWATVTVKEGTNTVCTATANALGTWSCASTLGVGSHTLTAIQTDSVGNASTPAAAITFSVKQAQSITFTAIADRTLAQSPFTVTASSTSGLNVTFTAVTPEVCTAFGTDGATITLLATSTCTIAANQPGDANFSPAPEVRQSFFVSLAPATIARSPASVDFGGQSINTTSPAQTITLTNTGGGALSLAAFTTTQGFAVTGTTCGTLPASLEPGTNCTVSITFTPAAEGNATGTLTIGSSAGSPTVLLIGLGEKSLVTHYYRAILNRAPDTAGHSFWQGEAMRLSALGGNINEVWFVMANYFFNSPEYIASNKSNGQFITDLYNTFFNRPPDQGGFDYWMGQMNAGLSREGVLFWFMFSNEFRTFTQGIFGNTAARPEVDMVMDLFRGIMNRFPDTAAFNAFVGQFRQAQCQGPGQVYQAVNNMSYFFIFDSGEYAGRNRSNTQYVSDMYNAFLRRGGDVSEVNFWINQLNTGGMDRNIVRANFINSGEFGARVQAVIAAGCVP